MAQNPAALHPDRTKRPRPHRPALVATPGASEWVSCVSSPATNRPGRTLEKGAGNLANSPAAFQISLTIRKPTADAVVKILRRRKPRDCSLRGLRSGVHGQQILAVARDHF